jgi:hypothetical protein
MGHGITQVDVLNCQWQRIQALHLFLPSSTTEMVSELNIPLSDDFIVPTNNDVGATSRTDGGKLTSRSMSLK